MNGHARLAWGFLAVAAVFAGFDVALNTLLSGSLQTNPASAAAVVLALVLPFGIVGAVIASRGVGGVIGWICLGVAVSLSAAIALSRYGVYGLDDDRSLPGAAFARYSETWTWVVFIGLIGVFFVLYFPDGRLPSRRWRWLPILAACGMAVAIGGMALAPGAGLTEDTSSVVDNPIGIEGAEGPLTVVALAGIGTLFVSIVSAMAAAVVRFRGADSEQRQQLKWFATAVVVTVAIFFSSWPAAWISKDLVAVLQHASLFSWGLLPLAAGIAILKYRLYEIDVVISRSLVYGSLTLFVLGVYAGLVAVADAASARGGAATSVLAAVVVAVAFAPVKERVQRAVDRLLYGERSDPYRALSQLGARLEAALAPEEVLPAIVGAVAQALRVPYAAIELPGGEGSHVAAAAGSPNAGVERVPLHYRGEPVGELVLGLRSGEAEFAPADKRLVDDLAPQVGVAAHAVALTVALQRSRERIVTAREEERRRLRRDLHDGLGPALAGVAMKLDAAARTVERDPERGDGILAELREQTQSVIADIRRLVYALRPPALDELGLVGALREHVKRLDGGLRLDLQMPEQLPPLPAAVEVAAYRIAIEALTNVMGHARARACSITLAANDALELEIADDGRGLPDTRRAGVGIGSMRERAAELGGMCTIEPRPQGGTTVRARLPLERP
ncbi:MAG TPA: sensor histidine kinase [Gaiellaceae bacterium]|nr:sensor histidine kinase [Gaiellaceae bacterium]